MKIKNSFLLLLILLISLSLFSCGKKEEKEIQIDIIEETDKGEIENSYSVSNYESDKDIVIAFFQEYIPSLSAYSYTYYAETVAKIGFINYTQKTDATKAIKGSEAYSYVNTSSTLVKKVIEAYFNGENASYKEDKKDIVNLTIDEYKEEFGYSPLDNLFSGLLINNETIVSVTKLENDNYRYEIVLDNELSSRALAIESKRFGDLKDLPVFLNISLILEINEDFYPLSLSADFSYKANRGVELNCRQLIEFKFTSISQNIVIPTIN